MRIIKPLMGVVVVVVFIDDVVVVVVVLVVIVVVVVDVALNIVKIVLNEFLFNDVSFTITVKLYMPIV